MTIEFYPMILTSIVLLFFARNPSTIVWLVVAIVVYAINGMFGGWRMSHVSEEIRECLPSFTNTNTAPTVVFVVDALKVHDSLFHIFPCMIAFRLMLTMDCLVFVFKTTTRQAYFSAKTCRIDKSLISTIALAKKKSAFRFDMGWTISVSSQYKPSTKALTGKINKFHRFISFVKYASTARRTCSDTLSPVFSANFLSDKSCFSVI